MCYHYKAENTRGFHGYCNKHVKEPYKAILKKLLFKVFRGEELSSKEDKLKTFWGFFDDFINGTINGTRKNSEGNTISENTIKSYKTLRSHLQTFEQQKRKKLHFAAMDLEFYADPLHFMQSHLKLAKNTISKHKRTSKTGRSYLP